MDYMTELAAIAKKHGGIIETKTAAQHGISKAMLYKLCKEEKISRIAKGQYILPNDLQDELLAIANRSSKIVFSHETALFLHGISDRTPFEHTITAATGNIPSAVIRSECKVYYIKPELFDLGIPAQVILQNYMFERLLVRLCVSKYGVWKTAFLY